MVPYRLTCLQSFQLYCLKAPFLVSNIATFTATKFFLYTSKVLKIGVFRRNSQFSSKITSYKTAMSAQNRNKWKPCVVLRTFFPRVDLCAKIIPCLRKEGCVGNPTVLSFANKISLPKPTFFLLKHVTSN